MLLMKYMITLNEFRTYVDWSEVEEVIVNDFINLDSFIHQVSWWYRVEYSFINY